MNNRLLIVIALASFSVAGCDRSAPAPAVESPPADTMQAPAAAEASKPAATAFTGPRAPADSIQVEEEVAEGAAQPLRMSGGEKIAAAFTPDRSGTLLALGVRIGNSRGTSDGSLTLNFCSSGACQDVSVALPGTQDNGYLIFHLTTPVDVIADQAYEFKLMRSANSTKPVAIWTHPAPPGSRTVTGVDNVDTGRVAKLVYYFKK